MLRPTTKEKKQTRTQPHTMTTGPPLFNPVPNWVVSPVRMEMMEKNIAKLVNRFCKECPKAPVNSDRKSVGFAYATALDLTWTGSWDKVVGS
jgi:hypothetical protein